MKKKTCFRLAVSMMHIAILSLFVLSLSNSAEAASGIGGSGGGPRAMQRVTVEVCDVAGTGECRMVTYHVRAESKAEAVECKVMRGEEGMLYPCPKTTGVPAWLQRLSGAHGGKVVKASAEKEDQGL